MAALHVIGAMSESSSSEPPAPSSDEPSPEEEEAVEHLLMEMKNLMPLENLDGATIREVLREWRLMALKAGWVKGVHLHLSTKIDVLGGSQEVRALVDTGQKFSW
jgi:hypothetical protein